MQNATDGLLEKNNPQLFNMFQALVDAIGNQYSSKEFYMDACEWKDGEYIFRPNSSFKEIQSTLVPKEDENPLAGKFALKFQGSGKEAAAIGAAYATISALSEGKLTAKVGHYISYLAADDRKALVSALETVGEKLDSLDLPQDKLDAIKGIYQEHLVSKTNSIT